MNKNLVALLVAVVFTCLYSEAQFKPRTYSIRFEQPIDGKSSVRTPVNLPAKIKRANSKAGTFKIFYDPDFCCAGLDEVKHRDGCKNMDYENPEQSAAYHYGQMGRVR